MGCGNSNTRDNENSISSSYIQESLESNHKKRNKKYSSGGNKNYLCENPVLLSNNSINSINAYRQMVMNKNINNDLSFNNKGYNYLQAISNKEQSLLTVSSNDSSNIEILDIREMLVDISNNNSNNNKLLVNDKNKYNSASINSNIHTNINSNINSKVNSNISNDIEKIELTKTLTKLTGHLEPVLCLLKLTNTRLISGSSDKTIKIWSIRKRICLTTLIGHTKAVNCLCRYSFTKILSGSSDNSIKLWDLINLSCIITLESHENAVNNIIMLNFQQIISSGHDDVIKVWSIENTDYNLNIKEEKEITYRNSISNNNNNNSNVNNNIINNNNSNINNDNSHINNNYSHYNNNSNVNNSKSTKIVVSPFKYKHNNNNNINTNIINNNEIKNNNESNLDQQIFEKQIAKLNLTLSISDHKGLVTSLAKITTHKLASSSNDSKIILRKLIKLDEYITVLVINTNIDFLTDLVFYGNQTQSILISCGNNGFESNVKFYDINDFVYSNKSYYSHGKNKFSVNSYLNNEEMMNERKFDSEEEDIGNVMSEFTNNNNIKKDDDKNLGSYNDNKIISVNSDDDNGSNNSCKDDNANGNEDRDKNHILMFNEDNSYDNGVVVISNDNLNAINGIKDNNKNTKNSENCILVKGKNSNNNNNFNSINITTSSANITLLTHQFKNEYLTKSTILTSSSIINNNNEIDNNKDDYNPPITILTGTYKGNILCYSYNPTKNEIKEIKKIENIFNLSTPINSMIDL